jgi:hypothetical protein
MSYLEIASKIGCAYTAWGPCFCNENGEKCKSCITADKIDELGLNWDEEFNNAELNSFKDPDYI